MDKLARFEIYGIDVIVYGTFEFPMFSAFDVADWIDHRLGRAEFMLKHIDDKYKLSLDDGVYITWNGVESLVDYFPRNLGNDFIRVFNKHFWNLKKRDMNEHWSEPIAKPVPLEKYLREIHETNGIGRKRILRWLHYDNYVYHTKDNKHTPYQRYIDKALFSIHDNHTYVNNPDVLSELINKKFRHRK